MPNKDLAADEAGASEVVAATAGLVPNMEDVAPNSPVPVVAVVEGVACVPKIEGVVLVAEIVVVDETAAVELAALPKSPVVGLPNSVEVVEVVVERVVAIAGGAATAAV